MKTDLLGRPQSERVIDASGKTSADDGGGYSFVFHGPINRRKNNDDEKNKNTTDMNTPPVKIALSQKAKEELLHEQDMLKNELKEDENIKEKDTVEDSDKIEISTEKANELLNTLLPENKIRKHKIDVKV